MERNTTNSRPAKIAAFAFAALGAAGALGVACQSRDYNNSDPAATTVDTASRKITVQWQCSSKSKENGLYTQEEYCQWTRRSRQAGKHLRCEFTTNFDMTRPFFLTKEMNPGRYEKNDYNGGKDKDGSSYAKVFSNSQAFLTGGTEPGNSRNPGSVRDGLIPTCTGKTSRRTIGKCANDITCVCDRKSDPQLCSVLGTITKAGCSAEPVATAQTKFSGTLPFSKTGLLDKPLVAVRLTIGKSMQPYCTFKNQFNIDAAGKEVEVAVAGVDPTVERTYLSCFLGPTQETNITSCDQIADAILADAVFEAKGSCDINALHTALNKKTPDACN